MHCRSNTCWKTVLISYISCILQNVLRFWLDKGVDGFRIDAAKHLFEAEDLTQDEPANPNATAGASEVSFSSMYCHEYM